jgi:RNA polymerase sigma-70 factor (ECF subfamily)
LRAGLVVLLPRLALLPPREVTPERDLDLLMNRLADGDRSAFEPLFRSLWPRALSAARRRLEAQAASDAAQSTMMKLFARAPEFERGAAVLPWFYAIAANEIRAIVRRSRAEIELDDDAAGSGGDPERSAMDRELRAAVAQAIEQLDGPSAEAIAALLGERERPRIDDAAFRKRVSRAYAKLRMLLGGHGER